MATTEATIDEFLAQEGGYFSAPARRKKRKSGAYRPASAGYMKPKVLKSMHLSGNLSTDSYHALTEVLADRRAKLTDEGSLVACVNADFKAIFARISTEGDSAEIYAQNCVGKDNEYEHTQRLLSRGFRCTVWRDLATDDDAPEGGRPERKMVVCNPKGKTATVYRFNFSSPDKAGLWGTILQGQGYDVHVRDC